MINNEQTYVIDDNTTVRIQYDEESNQMLAVDTKTGSIVCSSSCASNTFIKNDLNPYYDNFYEADSFVEYETAGILHEIEQCRLKAERLEKNCEIKEETRATETTCVGWALAGPAGCKPVVREDPGGSTPSRRTKNADHHGAVR